MIRLPRRLSSEPGERHPRFTDGLVAGALIGAAIAGSTLWSRLRRSRRLDPGAPPELPEPVGEAPSPDEGPTPG